MITKIQNFILPLSSFYLLTPFQLNQCNRVKGHGKIYANDVIKKQICNMNYRVWRKTNSIQQEIDRLCGLKLEAVVRNVLQNRQS